MSFGTFVLRLQSHIKSLGCVLNQTTENIQNFLQKGSEELYAKNSFCHVTSVTLQYANGIFVSFRKK